LRGLCQQTDWYLDVVVVVDLEKRVGGVVRLLLVAPGVLHGAAQRGAGAELAGVGRVAAAGQSNPASSPLQPAARSGSRP